MKQAKPLTREQYLKKFSRSARWRLGAAEAEEAISDYREMIYQEERDESKLAEELGDPEQAAWMLTEAKEYKRWTWVFGILTLGLALCAIWNWTGLPFFRFSWELSYAWRGWAVSAVGIALSWVWFQRYSRKSGAVSKWLLLALAAVFALGCAALSGLYGLLAPGRILETIDANGFGHVAQEVILIREVLIDGGALLPLLGFLGLVLARCYDRRWRALYILCLTLSAVFFVTLSYLHAMNLDGDILHSRQMIFRSVLPIAAVGLVGTGVSLC